MECGKIKLGRREYYREKPINLDFTNQVVKNIWFSKTSSILIINNREIHD